MLADCIPTAAHILAAFWSADDFFVEAPKLKVLLTDSPDLTLEKLSICP